MSVPRVTTVDFETAGIHARPDYPPRPVGVAIQRPGEKAQYLAWGHPTKNNAKLPEAKKILRQIWQHDRVLFFNAKFDLDVGETHLDLPALPVHGFEDAYFLAFLDNPHAVNLALKPLSERLLGIQPDERDALREWILANVPEARKKKTKWAAFIDRAPGDLAGRYAKGDVTRTRRVFQYLYRSVVIAREMREAYEREIALVPLVLEMERGGVPIDLPRLAADAQPWERWLIAVTDWIQRYLHAPLLNIDSNDDLADVLEREKKVDEWIMTKPSKRFPQGQRSVARDNLLEVINDSKLMNALVYRSKLANSLQSFVRPWLATAKRSGGWIYCQWHQVRSTDEKGKAAGARTGRFSSQPNFQNVTKTPIPVTAILAAYTRMRDEGFAPLLLAPSLMKRVGPLPHLRDYVVAPKGWALAYRDYSQQELRILAHYENGVLLKAYLDDPRMDMHSLAQQRINAQLHTHFARRPIKNLGFGLLYGMGIGKLADAIGRDTETARMLKAAYLTAFTGIKDMNADLKDRARAGLPIRLWDSRVYYVEEPKLVKVSTGYRQWTFEYKLLNTLIQGSAAGCTKAAMVYYYTHPHRGRLILTVHDELIVIARVEHIEEESERLRVAMEAVGLGGVEYPGVVKFDLPMLTDGTFGAESWAALQARG